MRLIVSCLPLVACLLGAAVGPEPGQKLGFRPQTAAPCRIASFSPSEISSFTAIAQKHFAKHRPDRYRGMDLRFLRACLPSGQATTTRIEFEIMIVSDVEVIYEMTGNNIRDAYLISYWN